MYNMYKISAFVILSLLFFPVLFATGYFLSFAMVLVFPISVFLYLTVYNQNYEQYVPVEALDNLILINGEMVKVKEQKVSKAAG